MLKVLLALKDRAAVPDDILAPHGVERVELGEDPVERLSQGSYDLMVVEDGFAMLPAIKATDPRVEVVLLGGEGFDEVEAVKLGATAHFPLPVDPGGLEGCICGIDELVESKKETGKLEKELFTKYVFSGVVGKNPLMLDIFNLLRRVSPYYKTVTITGATGTGKEVMARALHSVSPVSKEPFVACNCGGLVESLIESELFGHRKGAFTGATSDKVGIFESASGGTVFLDEVGELPLSFQPHLLRVLQNGEFRPVGATAARLARCRVIAATNRDLDELVRAGGFREDLYFRLTPVTVRVPPLRDRKDDIPLLSRFLLERFRNRTKKKVFGISMPAQTLLMGYDWPGNVRELENVIEQAGMLTTESFIRPEDLPPHIRESRTEPRPSRRLDDVVRGHIGSVLRECGGNRTHAARALGISRRSLIRKIEKHSIG